MISLICVRDTRFRNTKHQEPEGSMKKLWVGQSFSRGELVSIGTEQAGFIFDVLKDNGIWPWPNAGVILQKQGNRAVVVQILDEEN